MGKERYANMQIIMEMTSLKMNGIQKGKEPFHHDTYRIDWYQQYLKNLLLAYSEDGIDIVQLSFHNCTIHNVA